MSRTSFKEYFKKKVSSFKNYFKDRNKDNVFQLDGVVPLRRAIPFGLQHVLAMFIANITPIIIVFSISNLTKGDPSLSDAAALAIQSNAIRSAIFIAGIGTLIQLFPIWRIGSKLPIVVGISFTFVGALALVTAEYGWGAMIGAVMIGGLFIGILGLFAKYWRRFIKPIVSSCVVLAIGISLLSVGAQQFVGFNSSNVVVSGTYMFNEGWKHLLLASIALISSLLYSIFVKGTWKNLNILFGLGVGYIAALCIPGMVNFSNVFQYNGVTSIIDVPRFVDFTKITFNINAIVVVCIIFLVATTEGIGDLSALASSGLGREPTEKEISGGLACDGFVSTLSAIFGSMPLTTFSQNVGIVGQTKVVNRFTIGIGALFLILASIFPPITALIQTIPESVLGGCMIMLFASIMVIGMQMISKCGFSTKNITIVSLSLGLGYGITLIPYFIDSIPSQLAIIKLIISNPVANIFLISLILSFALPKKLDTLDIKEDKKEEVKESNNIETDKKKEKEEKNIEEDKAE